MIYFVRNIYFYLLSIILVLPCFSFSDEVKPPSQMPIGTVQVTPEEFKELKKEEIKDFSGRTSAPYLEKIKEFGDKINSHSQKFNQESQEIQKIQRH